MLSWKEMNLLSKETLTWNWNAKKGLDKREKKTFCT